MDNTPMMESINRFVKTMLEERSKFENIQQAVKNQEDAVGEILSRMEQTVGSLAEEGAQKLTDETVRETFTQVSASLKETITGARHMIQDSVKGMKFIHDFDSRFTVAVFGKVKAGKSYIGNFVMGIPLKNDAIPSAYDQAGKIVVQVYDRGQLSTQTKLSEMPLDDKEGGFATGLPETTSTIQWFELGGLSWFDTPGIGSVTWENEMLAKEYVKNADLVLYTCNSDAAGTRQDFAELKDLCKMEKPILLLLTQSDTFEFDVDDDGEEISILVPKSDKDRSDVEAYMKETLAEQGISMSYDLLTVSARLAVEALETGNEELFRQSNMGPFLERLIEITRNDAAEIKRATPRKRVNEMIDNVSRALQLLQAQLDEYCKDIESAKQALQGKRETISERVKTKVSQKYQEYLVEMKNNVEQKSVSISGEELAQKISAIVSESVEAICREELDAATDLGERRITISLSGIRDLGEKKESYSYEHTSVIRKKRPPEGFLEKVGEKLLHKEYYTTDIEKEMRTKTVTVGVNDGEVAESIQNSLKGAYEGSVQAYIDAIVRNYYEPIENLQKDGIAAVQTAITSLQELKQA